MRGPAGGSRARRGRSGTRPPAPHGGARAARRGSRRSATARREEATRETSASSSGRLKTHHSSTSKADGKCPSVPMAAPCAGSAGGPATFASATRAPSTKSAARPGARTNAACANRSGAGAGAARERRPSASEKAASRSPSRTRSPNVPEASWSQTRRLSRFVAPSGRRIQSESVRPVRANGPQRCVETRFSPGRPSNRRAWPTTPGTRTAAVPSSGSRVTTSSGARSSSGA